MSRIGKKLIEIPAGVKVTLEKDVVSVQGPKGQLSYSIRPEIEVKITDSKISVLKKKETKDVSAYWGLTRSLIFNMVEGVLKGYEKKLELVGVGYRAKQTATGISLSVGFSHLVEFDAPSGIKLVVEENNKIVVSGADKQLVGLTAAKIRQIRKPEPYKGKGIKYENEVVRRKAGKTGKV